MDSFDGICVAELVICISIHDKGRAMYISEGYINNPTSGLIQRFDGDRCTKPRLTDPQKTEVSSLNL
eukprot:scaffold36117_cov35-Prasinocladus_malaysianus.AAC.1